jgi:hypothetical protein
VTSPDHFSALFQAGVGYRELTASSASASLTSPEFLLGAGIWIPIGQHVRLVPRVDLTLGSFSGTDSNANNVSYGYAMMMFGVGGYYNIDFH